jgi:hypothetical protein
MKVLFFLLLLFAGSYFSTVRSLNPGVAHQRTQALVALNASKKNVSKNHDIKTGGIVGGVQTDVALQKNTFFGAAKLSFVAIELLADSESGEKTEHINSTTYGVRDVVNEAKSNYLGAVVGIPFVGVSIGTANYATDYKFRVGTPPSVSANDQSIKLDYTLLKVGTALNIMGVTFGVFGMEKKSTESYTYTYYDPSTGNKGTTEVWPGTTSATGYGAGLGFTSKSFRFEVSTEQMGKAKLEAKDNPLELMKEDEASSRTSANVEVRFWKVSLGARVSSNKGNFTDLEDLISSKLLYNETGPNDERLETSFNFGFGADQGFSFSAFYTQSEAKSEEESSIFKNDELYPAVTKSTAMGVGLSYYF